MTTAPSDEAKKLSPKKKIDLSYSEPAQKELLLKNKIQGNNSRQDIKTPMNDLLAHKLKSGMGTAKPKNLTR